jgi:hypothetical protein
VYNERTRRFEAPWEPTDQDDQEPRAGLWFSMGYIARQADKITERRVYYTETSTYPGGTMFRVKKDRWKNLEDVVAWADTEEECKRRVAVTREMDDHRRDQQTEANSWIKAQLQERFDELSEQAEAQFGTKLDKLCKRTMRETGYSDWFCHRVVHQCSLTVHPTR